MEKIESSLVSIIMPVYNGANYLDYSIESVIIQLYTNWELIIVDDKSSDESPQIIDSYVQRDVRIKRIFLTANMGAAKARNEGIAVAKGTYLCFLDCDDVWMPNKLYSQIEYLSNESLVMTYSSYYVINNGGDRVSRVKAKTTLTYRDMLKSNQVGNLTGIYNCSILGKIYFKNIGHEDYLFWLEIFKRINSAKGIVEPLAEYRVHRGSLSYKKWRAASWHWKILRREIGLNPFAASYYFVWYLYYGIKKKLR